ncbi:MAG TPA: arsenate reductase ArsC [Nitrososphaeraceae archaeon]|jgi:protein-tyrosine-phosphatase|nr:arsenate reductase ArsC [Nitrososphaeraceae archaeon]
MKLSLNKLKRQKGLPNDKTVLFVCVENAGRSQMAEGFFRKYAPRGYMTLSAGTKPSGDINPLAIEVMKEIGIDISNQKSKDITEDMMRNSTKIVNMGCMDKSFCPTLFIPNVIDWGIEDPKGKPIEKVREIRDDIDAKVRQLAAEFNRDNMQANL